MSSNFDYMYEGYDEVEASAGFSHEPLPSGWYYFKIEKLFETALSKNGSPQARMQLVVMEGRDKDRRTFATMSMGPADLDKNGARRTAEDKAKAANVTKAQMKGFLAAIHVNTGQPVGENEHRVFSFYNVGSWEGREFMGLIRLQPARGDFGASNQLQRFVSLEDPKEGLAVWRSKQGEAGVTTASAQTI